MSKGQGRVATIYDIERLEQEHQELRRRVERLERERSTPGGRLDPPGPENPLILKGLLFK